jgi:hypothetical protein
MEVATHEIIWLNEREEVEVSRDWSSRGLQLRDIEEYHKVIDSHHESLPVFKPYLSTITIRRAYLPIRYLIGVVGCNTQAICVD